MAIKKRYIKWIIPAVIASILLILDFVPGGNLKVVQDFKHTSPYISKLSPDGRVLEITEDENGYRYQPMILEPVYFDVRLPQEFNSASIEILFKKSTNTPLNIGVRIKGGDWSWRIKKVEHTGSQGSWTKGEVVLDLENAEYRDRKLRFILASPEIDISGEEIKIHKIEIKFTKEQLSLQNAFMRVKEYIKTWM